MLVLGRRRPLTALCPQYEQTLPVLVEPDPRQELRAQIRKNITETLVSLRVNTVDDIRQVAAALAQCTVGRPALGGPAPCPKSCLPSQACTAVPPGALGTRGLWSPPCCPGVRGQAGLGSVLMQAACRGGWGLLPRP